VTVTAPFQIATLRQIASYSGLPADALTFEAARRFVVGALQSGALRAYTATGTPLTADDFAAACEAGWVDYDTPLLWEKTDRPTERTDL
jgi:hypothetical protein